ncbi:MAG: hypothetical protein ACKO9H_09200, partial [Planctomycetota bacterium]
MTEQEKIKPDTAPWARSGDLRPAQLVLAAEPGAGERTRLTMDGNLLHCVRNVAAYVHHPDQKSGIFRRSQKQ